MNKHKAKLEGLKRRQRRVRGKVSGTSERPRLRVTRTNANIYAQIIADSKGSSLTLVSASTLEAEFKGTHTSNKEAAEKVGQLVGKRAIEAGITKVAFDRGGRIYHGRVKALADGARAAGPELSEACSTRLVIRSSRARPPSSRRASFTSTACRRPSRVVVA